MLRRLTLDGPAAPLPADIAGWIEEAERWTQSFRDRGGDIAIIQYVLADLTDVYRALAALARENWSTESQFCEWGCGLAVVSCMASRLGWRAVAIEAEPVLVTQADAFIDWTGEPVRLLEGNFLPRGAARLAEDPAHPALDHDQPPIYESVGIEVEQFDLIYGYPWPGEEEFFQRVFDAYAQLGSQLLLFCGPNDLRLFRKEKR